MKNRSTTILINFKMIHIIFTGSIPLKTFTQRYLEIYRQRFPIKESLAY
jgi:hypothetical protein